MYHDTTTTRIGATLFSGGRIAEALLTDVIDFRYAVECDPQIASVGAQLGGQTIVAKVQDVDYTTWGPLYYLHASPVCKNASQAKTDGEETQEDITSALAVVRCLEATEPRVFTLENVWGYRTFEAFRRICQALDRLGYMWHFEHVNAADLGVPQTRRRLILRAVRDALLPPLPEPEPWRGWYASIEDLIPGLPDRPIAGWAGRRIPSTRPKLAMIDVLNCSRDATVLLPDEPSMTIQAAHGWRPSQMPIFANGHERYLHARATARLQTIPDNYALTGDLRLDMKVIGNGAPSLMMSKLVRPLL